MARDPSSLITRHAPISRLFHWVTALVVLLLLARLVPALATGFFCTLHWITGLLLCVVVLFHALRPMFTGELRHMLIRVRHLREFMRGERAARYTLPQKLMHAVLGFAVLVACVTGALLLVRMGTPLWRPHPYLLGQSTWDTVRLLHHAAAVGILVLTLVHIVYYLLPGKRVYLRAMISGQMTRAEAAEFHDPARWSGQRKDDPHG